MRLRPYEDADLWLTEEMETDPEVMAELGGPNPSEDIPGIHRRRLEHQASGAWVFVIVPDEDGEPAGTVAIWGSEWEGTPIHEMGWMVRPVYQGRGLASAAVCTLLDRAREQRRFEVIHAFPGTRNAASNAVCRKAGFTLQAAVDGEYNGRLMRSNHWVIDLRRG